VDASGRIYVACDGDASIHVVASDGTPVCAWGSAGSGDGQFGSLGGLAVGASGNVYVSDFGNNRVEKFGDVPTATLRPSWGKLRTLYR
jgi:DNA-binding beta-propeller fold protein YncE